MIETVAFDAEGTREIGDLSAAPAADGTVWVHASDPTDAEYERLQAAFDLHALAVEDVRNDVRATAEAYDDHTFVLLKSVRLAAGDQPFAEEVATSPVGIFLGEGWLVTVTPESVGAVERVRASVADGGDRRLRERGAAFAVYRIADAVVDEYFDVLDRIEDAIEAVEEEVIESPDRETLERINATRRDLLSFRKQAWPAREAVGVLARGNVPGVDEASETYFRDVYAHLVQVVDLTETYRDLVSGARDIYLNALSQSTNEVMKVLTVVATIFIPLTFVAGVYGMNFDPSAGPLAMPELGWPLAYPAVMVGMTCMAVLMLWAFRRQGYL